MGSRLSSHPLVEVKQDFEPIDVPQLYERIRERIEAQIWVGAWRPGERLPPERQLAMSLGVSRPSLREALASLQIDNLLESRQGSGTWVAPDAQRALAELRSRSRRQADVSPSALLEARLLIEPATASLAAYRHPHDDELERQLGRMKSISGLDDVESRLSWNTADRLFHRRIAELSGNPVLAHFGYDVSEEMDHPLWRRLRDEMLTSPDRVVTSIKEHDRIYAAIRRGQASRAAKHAEEHVQRVRHFMGLDDSPTPRRMELARPHAIRGDVPADHQRHITVEVAATPRRPE